MKQPVDKKSKTPHPLSGLKISRKPYALMWNLPKVLLHEHFSGSSDVFEMARVAQMYIDQRLGESLDWIDPTTGELTPVSIEHLRNDLKARAYFLNPEHLVRLYRFANPPERHEIFVEESYLSKDGRLAIPESELQKKIESLREQGLSNYRATSNRINKLVKNESVVYGLASAFSRQLALENVLYAECRVSPLSYHCESIRTLVDRISEGLKLGEAEAANNLKFIKTGILLVIERHSKDNIQDAIRIAREAIQLRKDGYPVVGIDIAGDEWHYPVSGFGAALDIIKEYNEDSRTPDELRLGITVHAGETQNSGDLKGYEAIQRTIEMASSNRTPVRIGHGIQIINSSELLREAFNYFRQYPSTWRRKYSLDKILEQSPVLKMAIDRGIVFEMCPKSNVHTFAVPYHELHPAVFLSRIGLKVTISSDNRLISKSNACNEFVKLYKYANANYSDMKRMVLAGLEGAFIMDRSRKMELIQRAQNYFKEIEKQKPKNLL
jgi:adenosine deaminase